MKILEDLIAMIETMSKSGRVVYFTRPLQSGYLVSRDEFYPAAKDQLSTAGGELTIEHGWKTIPCKWSMYIFADVEDAIRAGKKYNFASNAKFIEVPYELAQQFVEWRQIHRVDADLFQKFVTIRTTYGKWCEDSNQNHIIKVPFAELDNVKIITNVDVKRINENGNKDGVYCDLVYSKTTSFDHCGEKFEHNISNRKVTLKTEKEIVNDIPPRHVEWCDIIEHEFFPVSKEFQKATKEMSRKIKITRDGKFYIAKLKSLSVLDTSEDYVNENGYWSTFESYRANWEWEEYEECSKEVIEKEFSDFHKLYPDDFWKVFYRFSSKEEYEAAYAAAYGDGKATEKAFSDMQQKIENFKKELEEVPFEMK